MLLGSLATVHAAHPVAVASMIAANTGKSDHRPAPCDNCDGGLSPRRIDGGRSTKAVAVWPRLMAGALQHDMSQVVGRLTETYLLKPAGGGGQQEPCVNLQKRDAAASNSSTAGGSWWKWQPDHYVCCCTCLGCRPPAFTV
jgi:hypothetical protein